MDADTYAPSFDVRLFASIGYLIVMALPLIVVIGFSGISTGATVGLYAFGLLLDVIAFIALAVLAFSYAARAARGELFTIPLVSPAADRILRSVAEGAEPRPSN